MAFWSNWTDGTKWLMGIIGGIISALIVAVLVKQLIGDGSHLGKAPEDPTPSISTSNSGIPAAGDKGRSKEPNEDHTSTESTGSSPQTSNLQEDVKSKPMDPRGGEAGGHEIKPEQPSQKKPFVAHQTADGFDFFLKGCEPDGNGLRCRVLVSSELRARKIMISNHSRLKIGEQSVEPSELIKDTGKDYSTAIHFEVPAGEQVEFSLIFPVQKSVREATLLEVKCAGRVSVTWDNPPIK